MIIRYSPGVVQQTGHYVSTVFNSIGGGWPGGVPTPEVPQTVSPVAPTVAINSSTVFTTNLPAIWTASAGSIVAAADGLSATFTAPGSAQSVTITATNEDDPGDIATTSVNVTGFGSLSQGEVVQTGAAGLHVGRSVVIVQ